MALNKIAELFRNIDEEKAKRNISSIEMFCMLVGVKFNDIQKTLDNIEITRSKISKTYMKLNEEQKKEQFKDYDYLMESLELVNTSLEEYLKDPSNELFIKSPSYILSEIKKNRIELSNVVRKLDKDFFQEYFSAKSKFNMDVEVVELAQRKDLFKGQKIKVQTYATNGQLRDLEFPTPKRLLGDYYMIHSAPNLAIPTYVHVALKTDTKKWQKEDILTFDNPLHFQRFLESINSNKSKKKKETLENEEMLMSVFRYLIEVKQLNPHNVLVLPWAVKKDVSNGKIKLEFTIAGRFFAHQVKKDENVYRDSKLKFNLIKVNKILKNPITNEEVGVWIISRDN